mgnify:FL=1
MVQEAIAMQQQATAMQVDAERVKGVETHNQNLEKEKFKTEGSIAKEATRSILSQVPPRVTSNL